MGYFSNGTEHMIYEDNVCSKCAHFGDCAVMDAHMIHNYDECNNDKSILDMLIPRKDVHNDKCKMFLDKVTGTIESGIQCGLCHEVFETPADLQEHQQEDH
jgi:hypothetical protein